jgi:hypothetical protein
MNDDITDRSVCDDRIHPKSAGATSYDHIFEYAIFFTASTTTINCAGGYFV